MSRILGLVLVTIWLVPGAGLAAQDTLSAAVRVRFDFGLPSITAPVRPDLAPGGRFGLRTPPALVVADWRRTVLARLAAARAARRAARLRTLFAAAPGVAPPPLTRDSALPPPALPAFQTPGRYVDLNLELNARVETRVDQLRNLNCTDADRANPASGCRAPFPTPVLGEQFSLRAGGVIADRLNLNVDFDSDRQFSADNNINIWYQGLEDEILKRVEVGNIDFRLPESRFITAGIPANSFGMQAEAQLGPLEIKTILAQQKGSSVRTRTFTVGDRASQNLTREQLDVEFEVGRFFFVVDPRSVSGYPALDILNLSPTAVPPTERPVAVRVYRLRAQSGSIGSNPSLGGIDAVALRSDSPQRVGPFPWDLLVEGVDYYLDPSGLWFALRNRISTEEYLAVSYVTAVGDTVGTFPATNGSADTLELIHEPRRGIEVPTAYYEMRNVYRVGTDVTRNSITATLRLNDSDRPLDGQGTYLSKLGLAQPSDPNRLDEYNRIFPRERDPNGGMPIRDLFVVFPHLQPFADAQELRGDERNDSLYTTPTYLLATEGPPPRFRFDWAFEASGSGDRSQLSLGALGVRDGSERLFVGDRELIRGQDYNISYDLGVVTFTNPDSLFAGPTQVRVQFEENQLFDFAPKNVLGFATTYNFGPRSRINAIGLFQRERSIFTRPRLGSEPEAMFMGGVRGEFEFRFDWLTNAINALPFFQTDVLSILELNGEVALSRPNPNQEGQAYIEEFETEAARRIQLTQNAFQLGSAPSSGRGLAPQFLSAAGDFDPRDAVPLVFQNAIEVQGGPFEVGPQQIDTSIVTTGTSQVAETLLWLSLKPDTVGGAPDPTTGAPRWLRPSTPGPRWRSITRALDRSGLGVDLSRTEFLEFWLLEDFGLNARQQNTTLVFDFGTVLEDAVAFAPESLRVAGDDTTFTGFQLVGQGVLDSERDPRTNVFNAAIHDIGILGDLVPSIIDATSGQELTQFPLCEQGFTVGLPVFPLGSLNARCTRRNGLVDSEDLNGDNRLDITLGGGQEDLVRYIVRVGDDRYVVRTGVTLPDVAGRPMTWRLYRIPFRRDTLQVGSPNLRQVQAMRLTVVTPDLGAMQTEVSFALARMRLVGAPWLKRAGAPLVGLGGLVTAPQGEVTASIISTDNQDLGYTSPPGVRDEAARRGAILEPGQQEINERSLRLIAQGMRAGERAEAFIRFGDEADKNFLKYRSLRVWARGRGAGWLEHDLEFFIKVGRDEDNFYLYRTPISSADWLPEVVVDLERWQKLRAEVERAWLGGASPSGSAACGGGDPDAYVACEGPYLIQVRDPGVAPPNLARVSEVAVGIYRGNETVVVPEAELWVDDIRLTEVVDDIGIAKSFDGRLTAADIAEFTVSMTSEDDRFRQLDDVPDYRGAASLRIGATLRADKFLPASWGFNIPVSVVRRTSDLDPFFVQQSDVRADELDQFRTPHSESTSIQVALRRTRRGESLAERVLLDPVAITASRDNGDEVTELSRSSFDERRFRLDYNNRPAPVTVAGAPGFLVNLVDGLPSWVSESEFGRALRTSRLRLNPQQIRFVSSITDRDLDRSIFRVPVGLPGDSSAAPLQSSVHLWRNDLGVEFRPFSSFGVRVDYTSLRDLRDYGDSTTVGILAGREQKTLFGRNVGFERDRRLETSVSLSPVVNSWLRPSFSLTTDFSLRRNPDARQAVVVSTPTGGGFRVPEAVQNFNRREIGSTLDLAQFADVVAPGVLARLFGGLLPADVRHRRTRGSTFDRSTFDPDFRYQLGFGGPSSFRQQQGSLANTAHDTEEWIAAGGAQLPLGFLVRVNYRDIGTDTWVRRGMTQTLIEQRTREWPSGGVTWVYSPRWGLRRAVSTLTAQAQLRESRTATSLPDPEGTGGVLSETRRRSLSPTLTVTWSNGVVTSARWSQLRSDVVAGGNLTRNDQTTWGGTMTFSIRSPTWLARLPSDVRATVGLSSDDVLVCLRRPDVSACSPVTDTRRREVRLQLDTAFPPNMRGGANFSYVVTDARHTSNRFSELAFSIFLDINFLASQIR